MEKDKKFRLSSKKIMLTYPRLGIELEDLRRKLKVKLLGKR